LNTKKIDKLKGLPEMYISVIKEAVESGLTPGEIREIIELGRKFKAK
jgi:hypothetical protein